jgi:hypothetical protein
MVRPVVPALQAIDTISCGGSAQEVADKRVVELAGDVALEAADDLGLGLAFGGAALDVGAGALAVAQPTDGDHVQGAVGVAITAVVEAMPVAATAGDRDRAGGAQWPRRRPRCEAGRCSGRR